MTARLRPDLDALPGYVPGKSLRGAIKLASNEVAAGPLPGVTDAITAAATETHRYPDSGATVLTETLATRLGVPAAQVAVGCGSVSVCQQLVQATCVGADDEVLFAWRSFEAYPVITQVAGAWPRTVPLLEQTHDLPAMLAAVGPTTRLVFICNPNNPTGTALGADELTDFLDKVPSQVLVVLDEAYTEFTDDTVPDGMDLARGRDNVVVLRTFSKAWGLAGLRVGYAVAAEPVVAALRKVYLPFSVNHVAQAAALASLEAEDEMRKRCAAIVAERGRVLGALRELGHDVPPSQANFVWLPLGERAAEFTQHCAERKIVVRGFAGDGVRVTVGEPAENDAFLDVAGTFEL